MIVVETVTRRRTEGRRPWAVSYFNILSRNAAPNLIGSLSGS